MERFSVFSFFVGESFGPLCQGCLDQFLDDNDHVDVDIDDAEPGVKCCMCGKEGGQ